MEYRHMKEFYSLSYSDSQLPKVNAGTMRRNFLPKVLRFWWLLPAIMFLAPEYLQAQERDTRMLDIESIATALLPAPWAGSAGEKSSPLSFSLPMPGEKEKTFHFSRYQLMAPDFEALYPSFRTYKIQAADDPKVWGRATVTPYGIMATIFTPEGIVEIFPQDLNAPAMHVITEGGMPEEFICGFNESFAIREEAAAEKAAFTNGATLRTYNLAIVTTGEFGQTHGGTVASASAVVISQIAALEALYEKELAVHFNLLTPVIYTDPSSDPFPSTNADRTRMAAEAVALNWPNSAQYDLGHVLHSSGGGQWGGGVAYFGLCSNFNVPGSSTGRIKAGAWSTVGNSPAGTLSLLAHEVGHQFHMPHTFNGSGGGCTFNIDENAAYEIGSGTTIMSYKGLCSTSQNVPGSGAADNYFHTTSLEAAVNRINTLSCSVNAPSGNTPPVVNANPCGANPIIPIGTPFRLTGSGSDADGDVIYYSWEQIDEDGQGITPTQGYIGSAAAASTIAPLFRSYPPGLSPSRTFPNMGLVVANNYASSFEPLPSVARTIRMQLTGRDWKNGGGGVHTSVLQLTVASAGPFTVTSPNGGGSFTAGSNITVNWNVNGTNALSSHVNIRLSVDGGQSFPYLLIANTPNDGSQSVVIPAGAVNTSKARIMVESAVSTCVVFFDISNGDFGLISSCNSPSTEVSPTTPLTLQSGGEAISLNMSNNIGVAVPNFSGVLEDSDPSGQLVYLNGSPPVCAIAGNVVRYDAYLFSPSVSGLYTFTRVGAFGLVLNLYQAPVQGTDCSNHIISSAVLPAGSSSVNLGTSISASLTAGTQYILMVGSFNTSLPALPSNYTINFTVPTGASIYNGVILPAGYAYTYLAVNAVNNQIAAVNSTSVFPNLPAGSYCVYGAAYKASGATPPAIVNPSNWIGQTITAVLSGGDCVMFSSNCRPLTITSSSSCTAPFVSAPTVTQPSCTMPSGAIVINATGSGALEYSINNGTSYQTSNTFSGLTPGSYNIRVRLQSNPTCQTSFASNPVVINTAPGAPTVSVPTVTQPSCTASTGTIQVNATGSGTLEYSINNGSSYQLSNTFSGLTPGSYNIRVRLQSNTTCQTAYSGNPVVINTAPGAPTISAPTVTQPSCTTPTGAIVVNASGSGTLEYSINNGSSYQLSNVFSGLTPGSYNIRVRLQSNPACQTAYSGNPVVINTAPGAPAVSAPTVTQPSCTTPTGTILVNATGSGTLEYSINNGASYQVSNTFSGLMPGSYTVRVRLQSNTACQTAYSGNPVVLNTAPGAPSVSAPAVTQPSCTSPSGSIVVNATGSGALEYSINNGVNYQPSNTFSGLAPGNYYIRVRLQSDPACQTAYSGNPVVINNAPAAPLVNAPSVIQPNCTMPSGTIVVDALGSGILEYSINDGASYQLSHTFSGLAPGSYHIRVRQQSNPTCQTAYSGNPVVINAAPGAPMVSAPTVLQPNCSTPSGAIIVNATGSGALEYSINNGLSYQLSNSFSGLAPGSYNIRVRLQSNTACQTAYSGNPVVIVTPLSPPVVNAPSVTQPTGCSSPTGTITVNASAGGALEYSINNGTTYQLSNIFNSLAPGSYNIRVRLQAEPACNTAYANNPVVIQNAPSAPLVQAPLITQPTCSMPTGSIAVNAQSGGPLEYSINNGVTYQSTNTFSGLAPGNYNIRVRLLADPACNTAYSGNPVVISAAPASPVLGAPSVTQPTCAVPAGSITVNATGAGVMEYSINNGLSYQLSNIFSGLQPGSYQIRVRLQADPACNSAYSNNPLVIEPVPALPVVGIPSVTQSSSCASPTGSITINASGSGTLEYSIDDGNTFQSSNVFNSLIPGNYLVRVRLQAHPTCVTSYTGNPVVIQSPPAAPAINAPVVIQPRCSAPAGTIVVNASGSGALEYSINDGASYQLSNVFGGLAPGNYHIRVRVQSAPSCQTAYSGNPVAINTPPPPPVIADPTVLQPQGCAVPSGTITVNAGGSSTLEYSINNGSSYQSSPIFTGLAQGNYFVRVRVQSDPGCQTAFAGNPVVIQAAPVPPAVGAPNVTQPSCASPSGSIVVNASGAGALEYSINDGAAYQSSPEFSGLTAGNYSIRVRLQSQPTCTSTYTGNPVVITASPNAPVVSAPLVVPPTCTTLTGAITVQATGSGALEYSINNGSSYQANPVFSGLPPGSYSIRVRLVSDPVCSTVYPGNPVVLRPDPDVTAPTVTQPSCAEAAGSITVNATGSVALEYSINNGATFQTSNAFGGLAPGEYNIRVRLQGFPGCNAAYSGNPVVIQPVPTAPRVTSVTITQPTCDAPQGSISIAATGSGPLEYSIDNGASFQPSAAFSTLAPGSYHIQVRLQSAPTCLSTYPGNPVILVPATGCCTEPVLQCANDTITFNGQSAIVPDPADLVSISGNHCGILSITTIPAIIPCQNLGQATPVTVRVTDSLNNVYSCSTSVFSAGLPCGWSQTSSGVNCPDGNSISYNYNTGVFTARSTNCYYTQPYDSDAMAFAQYSLCGNGSITARVTSISGTAPGWAGIVMRENAGAGAKKVQLMTNMSSVNRREQRTVTNEPAATQQFLSYSRYWLRIVRMGDLFSMYTSQNGHTWFFAGSATVSMEPCIMAGLVLTNFTASSTVTATFTNVAVVDEQMSPYDAQMNELQLEAVRETADFSVFPNPSAGEIALDLSDYMGKPVRVELYSLQGQLMYFMEQDQVLIPLSSLDLSAFFPGMYLIRVKTPGLPDVTKRLALQ